MQLPQKKMFSKFFLAFSQFRFNFQHFQQKITLIADVFFDLRTAKTWLDKCLKSFVSEDTSTSDMVNGPRHC